METTIIGVITMQRLEVAKEAALPVTDVGATPRVRCEVEAASSRVLPLRFSWKTETIDEGIAVLREP